MREQSTTVAKQPLLECRDYRRSTTTCPTRITRKHLLKKIHHLEKLKPPAPGPRQRQTHASPAVELVPPDRHKLVFRCSMGRLLDWWDGWLLPLAARQAQESGIIDTRGLVLSICLSVCQSCTSLEHKVPFAPSYALQIAHAHPRTTINRKPLLYDMRRSNPPPHVHGIELVGQFWGWMGCTWVGSILPLGFAPMHP